MKVGAIFIFVILLFGATTIVPRARAYAVGSATTGTAGSSGSYDLGNSFKRLISPFTGFFGNLKLDNNTTINTAGQAPAPQTVNFTPAVASGIRNLIGQCFSQIDNWFYGVSGIRLSGLFFVFLNALAWTLGLAQKVVNWLLGLFN